MLPSGVETILPQFPVGILEGDDATQFLPRLVVNKSFPFAEPATILSPTFGVVLLMAIPENFPEVTYVNELPPFVDKAMPSGKAAAYVPVLEAQFGPIANAFPRLMEDIPKPKDVAFVQVAPEFLEMYGLRSSLVPAM